MTQSFSSEPGIKKTKAGRRVNEKKADAFKRVAPYLQESDTEQITTNGLIIKMKDYAVCR